MFLKKRSLFAFLIVFTMIISVSITGCKDDKSKSQKDDNSPLHLDVFITRSGKPPKKDNKIFKMIEDEFNITFDFEYLAGDLDEKLGVMIAGGDYPDLITGDDGNKLIEAEAFIPLEDMIKEDYSNLYEHYKPYWNRVKEADSGHFYVMPNFGRMYNEFQPKVYEGGAFWIQKAVLKEFNYPKPTTLDEYFDLIKKYKDKYPTIDGKKTIGFEILSDQWRSFCLRNPPEYLAGYPNDGGVIVDQDTFKAEIFADKDISKQYYEKLNEVNQLGLINKDTFVQNYDQYQANVASGRVLGMYDQHWQFKTAENSLKSAGLIERTYAPLPITFDEDTEDWYRDRPLLNLHNGFGITVNCEQPERVLKMFDTFLTKKWMVIYGWGIEGEDYMVDENGMYYRTEKQRQNALDETWKLSNKAEGIMYDAPKWEGTFDDGNDMDPFNQLSEYKSTLTDFEIEMLKEYDVECFPDLLREAPENPKYYPAWQIDLVDGSEASIADQKLQDVQIKYLPKLILAETSKFNGIWDEYVKEIKKLDIKAYEDRINEQIQWRLKNW